MTVEPRTHRWITICVAVVALLICTNGPVFFVGHLFGKPQGTWETPRVRVPFLAAAMFGLLLLLVDRTSVRALRPRWPLIVSAAYLALGLASAVWSPLPLLTFGRATIYVGLGALALWLAQRTFRTQLLAIGGAMAVATIVSVITVKAWPDIGLMITKEGYFLGWQGIFTNRNSLAPVAALGVLSSLGLVADRTSDVKMRLPWLAVAMIELGALSRSRSDTAKVALLVALTFGALLWPLARIISARLASIAAALTASAIVLAVVTRPARTLVVLSQTAGRSTTLSSRTLIWGDVVEEIRRRPLLGHGTFTFWDVPAWTERLYTHVGSAYGEAHNSLLEVALGLGLVGAALFLGIVLAAVFGNLRRYWRDRSLAGWWWATVAVYLVLINLTESFVLWFSYNWVVLIAAALVPLGIRQTQQKANADAQLSMGPSPVPPLGAAASLP